MRQEGGIVLESCLRIAKARITYIGRKIPYHSPNVHDQLQVPTGIFCEKAASVWVEQPRRYDQICLSGLTLGYRKVECSINQNKNNYLPISLALIRTAIN